LRQTDRGTVGTALLGLQCVEGPLGLARIDGRLMPGVLCACRIGKHDGQHRRAGMNRREQPAASRSRRTAADRKKQFHFTEIRYWSCRPPRR